MTDTLGEPVPTGEADRPTNSTDPPAAAPAGAPAAYPAGAPPGAPEGAPPIPELVEGWRVWLPAGVHAGIHAERDHETAALRSVGEGWVGHGELIPAHSHDVWELYLQLHGRSTWEIGTTTVQPAAGWVLAIPPGLRLREVVRTQARHHFTYAVVDLAEVGRRHPELQPAWRTHRPRWSARGRALAPLFRVLISEVATRPSYSAIAVGAAVDLLVTQVTRLLEEQAPTGRARPRHPAVARARQLLDDQYATAWTVGELAAACAISRSRLAELFTAEIGQPPYDYLLERRVERACELLVSTPYSVSEVAASVGFRSHVQLARHVRRITGRSPTGWRAGT